MRIRVVGFQFNGFTEEGDSLRVASLIGAHQPQIVQDGWVIRGQPKGLTPLLLGKLYVSPLPMDQSQPAVSHEIRLDLNGPAKLFFGLGTPPLIQEELSQGNSGFASSNECVSM